MPSLSVLFKLFWRNVITWTTHSSPQPSACWNIPKFYHTSSCCRIKHSLHINCIALILLFRFPRWYAASGMAWMQCHGLCRVFRGLTLHWCMAISRNGPPAERDPRLPLYNYTLWATTWKLSQQPKQKAMRLQQTGIMNYLSSQSENWKILHQPIRGQSD